MQFHQFRYGQDNLAYLICGEKTALAVDPGAVSEILSFLAAAGIKLQAVVNTHSHPDHTSGNTAILAATDAEYFTPEELIGRSSLVLEGRHINIYHTPGHTEDSLIYHVDSTLITGDTLFTGKVGRCFTGDRQRFLQSVKFIMDFPPETVIYGGHDYVLEYLDTAARIEPENEAIAEFRRSYDPARVCSTLADEFRINPTLRFNTDSLASVLKQRGLPADTEYDRWCSILSIV